MTESLSSTVLLSRIARVETGEDILLSRHPSSPPIMRTDGIALPRKPTLDGDVDRSFLTEDLKEQPNNSGEDRESSIRSNGPVLLVYELRIWSLLRIWYCGKPHQSWQPHQLKHTLQHQTTLGS